MSKWTQFYDMHSGGRTKEEPYNRIYIEAPEREAKVIFYNRFGHNPERITCTCCGEDYSISEYNSLCAATKYDRESGWGGRKKKLTLAQYRQQKDVLIIRAVDIRSEERIGDVPIQGYVWQD